MTGQRLRTDCAEFRRKPNMANIGKFDFHDLGFSWKSLVHRMPQTLSLEAPVALKKTLGRPCYRNKSKSTLNHNNKNKTWKPISLQRHARQMSRLALLKSSQLERRVILATKRILDIHGHPLLIFPIINYSTGWRSKRFCLPREHRRVGCVGAGQTETLSPAMTRFGVGSAPYPVVLVLDPAVLVL